jgi:hypothetical protein
MRLGDRVIRVSTTAAVILVAAVAALVSYKHAVAVIEQWGQESWLTARLIPATVDGLMGTSSMILLWCARYRLPVPRLARSALGLGIVATIGTNALHGLSRGPLAAVIAAWPAVALVISYELLMWVVKSGRELADVTQSSFAYDEPKIRETPEPLLVDADEVYEPDIDKETIVVPILTSLSEPDVAKIEPKPNTSNGHVERPDMSDSDRIAVVLSFLDDDPDLSGAEIGRRFGRDSESGAKWGVRLKAKALASVNGKPSLSTTDV